MMAAWQRAETCSTHVEAQQELTGVVFDGVKLKVKVKLPLEQATKAQRGSSCIALLFL
jgi:hypothetical protein